ncbi:MAG: hypothetical protein NTY39_07185 [Campylobacterales bacterium]|nr:hypothetical protein [Campylobacterales bacterium]
MKNLILLLLLSSIVWGSKILSYNIYDRHERVDVMLTFDTPYDGVLRQNMQGDMITIKLEEASIDTPLNKSIISEYLKQLTIDPVGDQIQISAKVGSNVILQASKTSDSYGLRLRFIPRTPVTPLGIATPTEQENTSALPTKKGNEFEQSYYVVIGILILGIIILIWLKQSIAKKATELHSEPKKPWSFNGFTKNTSVTTPPETSKSVNPLGNGGVNIRFQKTLDPVHSVAMLDFGTQSYLVLLGNNTILLDKFQDNIPVTQNEFETLLRSKHQELDSFFQLGHAQDETFDTYKEKASLI